MAAISFILSTDGGGMQSPSREHHPVIAVSTVNRPIHKPASHNIFSASFPTSNIVVLSCCWGSWWNLKDSLVDYNHPRMGKGCCSYHLYFLQCSHTGCAAAPGWSYRPHSLYMTSHHQRPPAIRPVMVRTIWFRKVGICRSLEMWRSVDYLYFHWKYR